MLVHGMDHGIQIKHLGVTDDHYRTVRSWVAVVSKGIGGISLGGKKIKDEPLLEYCLRLAPKEFNELRKSILSSHEPERPPLPTKVEAEMPPVVTELSDTPPPMDVKAAVDSAIDQIYKPRLGGLIEIVQPDRITDSGHFFFAQGFSHSGAEYGSHLTRDEVVARLTEKAGPGELVEKDGRWFWKLSPVRPA